MNAPAGIVTYKVLATDGLLYGPIDLPALIQWTKDERVLSETWILRVIDNKWFPASLVSDLRPYFAKLEAQVKAVVAVQAATQVQPEELRQFSLFTGVSNEQLAQFLKFAGFFTCERDQLLLKKGDPGDAIFFLLSGQVRARIIIGGDEKNLTTIKAGEFFGEMAMLTQSARSADVVVVEPSRLLRLTAQAFVEMGQQLPLLACPILFAMSRTLATRIADLNQQWSRDRSVEYIWR